MAAHSFLRIGLILQANSLPESVLYSHSLRFRRKSLRELGTQYSCTLVLSFQLLFVTRLFRTLQATGSITVLSQISR
jgi:hypothetical protein